jgi:hypothetical protein
VSNSEVRFGDHRTDRLTFAPNVTLSGGNAGDERTKELWDEWGGLAEDEKQYRYAKERLEKARRELSVAASEVERLGEKLRTSHERLAKKLNVPPMPESFPVPEPK